MAHSNSNRFVRLFLPYFFSFYTVSHYIYLCLKKIKRRGTRRQLPASSCAERSYGPGWPWATFKVGIPVTYSRVDLRMLVRLTDNDHHFGIITPKWQRRVFMGQPRPQPNGWGSSSSSGQWRLGGYQRPGVGQYFSAPPTPPLPFPPLPLSLPFP